VSCRICESRKPRRYCPGVVGDICAPCCGTERENTVSCPLDCEYLLESRRHERFDAVDPDSMPNRDIRVSEEFLGEHEQLLGFLSRVLLAAALQAHDATDRDVRDALEALIKTYRTRQSGLIYETRPDNPYAGMIVQHVNASLEQFQEELRRESGMRTLRDTDVLGVLVFVQRIAVHWDNKRPRGRSFLSLLFERHGEQLTPAAPEEPPGSLLLP
jgi:hypothetical protein